MTNGKNPHYLGSGKLLRLSIKKYGRENFSRKTLYEFEDGDSAYMKELFIVNENFIAESTNYNLQIGGSGQYWNKGRREYGTMSQEQRDKISKTMKERGTSAGKNNPQYGKPLSESQRTNLNRSGVTLTEDHKEKIRQSLTGRHRGPYRKKEK